MASSIAIAAARAARASRVVGGAGAAAGIRANLAPAAASHMKMAFSSKSQKEPKEKGTTFLEVVDRYADILFLSEIFRGLWLTAEAMSKPKVTINYPFEKVGRLRPDFPRTTVLLASL
jgi:hypothetical protein